jgi:hypothetical protein
MSVLVLQWISNAIRIDAKEPEVSPLALLLSRLIRAIPACLLKHLIKIQIDVDWYRKYQYVTIGVNDSDLADVPGLVDRSMHVGAVLTGMFRKPIDITAKVIGHRKVERYSHAF